MCKFCKNGVYYWYEFRHYKQDEYTSEVICSKCFDKLFGKYAILSSKYDSYNGSSIMVWKFTGLKFEVLDMIPPEVYNFYLSFGDL